jgi:hypothetical protein
MVLLALGAVVPSVVVAQAKGSACDLLTPKEITDVIGLAVAGDGRPSDIPVAAGPAKGETMHACSWRAGQTGMVNVNTIRAPSADQRAAGLARMRQAYEALKAKGWTEKSETFGPNLKCTSITPPANEDAARTPSMTGCMGEANGMGIGVGFMAPGTPAPIAKVKALYDKAAGRIS